MTTTLHLRPCLTVHASGAALPGREVTGARLTNQQLSELTEEVAARLWDLGAPAPPPCAAEFPRDRIGVLERRVLDRSLDVADLAIAAARRAMDGQDPGRLRVIVVATVSATAPIPAVAVRVAGAVGAPEDVYASDLVLGCSGYMAALELAEALLSRAPSDALALVVGAEAMTRVLDAADRATLPIFGDGAGALVVSRSFEDGPGVSPCARMTRPAGGPNIRIEPKRACEGPLLRLTAEGGRVVVTEEPGTRLVVRMRGRAVFRDMLRALPAFVRGALAERGQALEEFARVALHQANARLVEAVATGLELPPERLLQNIARVGNTTGASLPLLLDGAARRGLLRAGDDVLLVGFGAGYSAAITSLRWS